MREWRAKKRRWMDSPVPLAKTTLILGAGSSVDFNLPTGANLGLTIAKMLRFQFQQGSCTSGDRGLVEFINVACNQASIARDTINDFYTAAMQLSAAQSYSMSIDDLLHKFGESRESVRLGKAAILLAIADAERGSKLKHISHHDESERSKALDALSDTWIHNLFVHLQSSLPKRDVLSIFDNINIINFNYDRCVEQYLFAAVQRAFAINELDASKVMETLKIVHPYGRLPKLPWESQHHGIPFGQRPNASYILNNIDNISTFTEQIDDENLTKFVANAISQSDIIAFMGFAFHHQNMKLLSKAGNSKFKKVYATALFTSPEDREVFCARIQPAIYPDSFMPPNLIEVDCGGFVRRLGQTLTTH